MFLVPLPAGLEGALLSKAHRSVRRRRGATDNAVQKLYLEGYILPLLAAQQMQVKVKDPLPTAILHVK